MPRLPSIWQRKEDKFYYTTFQGKQIKLSEDKDEAQTAFHALHSQKEEVREVSVFPTFRKLADLFIKDSLANKKPTTTRMNKYYLQSFCDHIKKKRVNDLKVHHVTEWINAPKPKVKAWNSSSACSARATILACLNWSVEQGYIKDHPLTKLKRGSHKRKCL